MPASSVISCQHLTRKWNDLQLNVHCTQARHRCPALQRSHAGRLGAAGRCPTSTTTTSTPSASPSSSRLRVCLSLCPPRRSCCGGLAEGREHVADGGTLRVAELGERSLGDGSGVQVWREYVLDAWGSR